jgi:hypothetical protein
MAGSIKRGEIKTHYKVLQLNINSPENCEQVRALSPHHIDWGDLADALPPQEFLELAENCSADHTSHTAHFLSWNKRVIGARISDYGEKRQEVFNKVHKTFQEGHKQLSKLFPSLTQSLIIDP